jgi:hypothetical protein
LSKKAALQPVSFSVELKIYGTGNAVSAKLSTIGNMGGNAK